MTRRRTDDVPLGYVLGIRCTRELADRFRKYAYDSGFASLSEALEYLLDIAD